MKQLATGELLVVFAGEENGQHLRLELDPEVNIRLYEEMQIMLLITACTNKVINSYASVMQFIRVHQLERHFNISIAS